MAKAEVKLDEVEVKSSGDVLAAAVAAGKAVAEAVPTDVSNAASVEDMGGTVRVRW